MSISREQIALRMTQALELAIFHLDRAAEYRSDLVAFRHHMEMSAWWKQKYDELYQAYRHKILED